MTLFNYRVKFDSLPDVRKPHMLADMSSSPMPYPLRMPDDLRERLKSQAKAHDQSLHAEILSILQAATGNPSLTMPLDVDALADALAPKIAARLRDSTA
jgi:plasmid stability protein